jgi:signal transduction histidine kinase
VQYVHAVSRFRHLVRTYGFDALIVVLTAAAILQLALGDAESAPDTTLWFCIPAVLVMALPLFWRKRFPFAAPALYWLLAAGLSFVDGELIPYLGSLFVLGAAAAFLLGNLRDPLGERLGLALVIACAAVIVYHAPNHSSADLLFIPLLFAIGWLAGFVLRERAEQAEEAEERAARAEREREAAARLAVAEERARIARELHDVVAHAVSVMVLQVGAVRHKLPGDLDEEDRDALEGVEKAGRTALTEMRRLLAAMREEGEDAELAPQPGLDDLESLADEVGRAGLPVHVHLEGEPFALPRALDLSAYRVVQEGLTNALKHARASAADVTVRYGPDEVQVEVRDDGAGGATSDGLGHGLVGIRERVKIYGGEMSAGPANGTGFVLSARFPIGGERP